ncbi:MAG: DUF4390 domain-containing protein [Gammaproteobacteria bacterium]|nr:MAG: DUF4390 domain-containing protein [Gammaproteobacteria bacterium]
MLLISGELQAGDESGAFVLTEAEVELGESAWLLNAWLDIRLSSGAREALENGVPLVFEFRVQARKKHPWLWDQVIAKHRQVREVVYHALSRTYIVRDINTGEQRGFRRLDEAMQSVGVLLNISVLDYGLVEDGGEYSIRLRGTLDIESLPTPIRLLAYVSNTWYMNSEWYQWQLER